MKPASSHRTRLSLSLLTLLVMPSLVLAHGGHGGTHAFSHGTLHPLGGLDHLCAMLAVGLWAAQMGGRALWAVPLTFVGVMALGGAAGMLGWTLPFVEPGIVLSVLLLGVLIAAAVRLPLTASTILVGAFALFHGHAHGTEMPFDASGLAYAAGFVLTTAALHTAGIGVGITLQKLASPVGVRFAGAAIALCAAWIWLG